MSSYQNADLSFMWTRGFAHGASHTYAGKMRARGASKIIVMLRWIYDNDNSTNSI